jgi:hypothetical protein
VWSVLLFLLDTVSLFLFLLSCRSLALLPFICLGLFEEDTTTPLLCLLPLAFKNVMRCFHVVAALLCVFCSTLVATAQSVPCSPPQSINGFWTQSYCSSSGQGLTYSFDDAACELQRVVRINLDLGGACSGGVTPPLSWPPPGDEWQMLTRCPSQTSCNSGCVLAGFNRMGKCVHSTQTTDETSPFFNFSTRSVLNIKGTASGTLYYRGRNCTENYGLETSTEHGELGACIAPRSWTNNNRPTVISHLCR